MSAINTTAQSAFSFQGDGIVIRHYGHGIHGGKVLNVDGFNEEFIRTGHVIIMETATETYKPLGVSNGNYVSLPSGHEYAGVSCSAPVPTTHPWIGIMNDGVVNDVASPFPITTALKAALKTALPKLSFEHD